MSNNFEKCWSILTTEMGINPQSTNADFMKSQRDCFDKICNLYNQKTEKKLMEWLNNKRESGCVNLTFEDWLNEYEIRKELKLHNKAKMSQVNSTLLNVEKREFQSISRVDNEKQYYLWDLIKKPLYTDDIHINEFLLDHISKQVPIFSTPFRRDILSYMCSDSNVPLVLTSEHYYKK